MRLISIITLVGVSLSLLLSFAFLLNCQSFYDNYVYAFKPLNALANDQTLD